jgi:DNA replication protein DnaC
VARARAKSLEARIPKRFRYVAFDRPPVADMALSLTREIRRFANEIDANLDQGDGLWLMGETGTGKTTLAMLVSKAALDRGRTVAIYSLPRLLDVLRRSYDEDSAITNSDLLEQLAGVDLLHLDDVGAQRTNAWVLEQLYSIVNARYEEEKSIVLTTNVVDRAELAEQLGQRTVSRLTEMCRDVPVFGEDRREALRTA